MSTVRKQSNQSIFIQYLLSYLLVLIIPIIGGVMMYRQMIDVVEKDAVQSNLALLEQSKSSLEGRLAEVDNIVRLLSLDSKVTRLLAGGNNMFYDYELNLVLRNYKLTNNFIDSILVYINDSDKLISSDLVMDNPGLYYGTLFQYQDLTYEQWKRYIVGKTYYKEVLPTVNVSINGKEEPRLAFLQTIPINNSGASGAIMVLIKQSEVQNMIRPAKVEDGWVTILNESESRLVAYGDIPGTVNFDAVTKGKSNEVMQSRHQLIFSVFSPDTKWSYVAAIPKDYVMGKVNAIKMTIIAIMLIVIGFGVFVSYMLTNRNFRPIKKLFEFVKDNLGNENGRKYSFDSLQGSISELLNNNEKLKLGMMQKTPLLKAAFIERVFSGRINNGAELQLALEGAELVLPAADYVVFIVRIDSYGDASIDETSLGLSAAKVVFEKTLTDVAGTQLLVHDFEEDRVAVLFPLNAGDQAHNRAELERLLNGLHSRLKDNNGISTSFSVGSGCPSLLEAYRSFRDALDALQYGSGGNERIVWYDAGQQDRYYFYYPTDMENKLINLLKIGDIAGVTRLVGELREENVFSRKLSREVTGYFQSAIRNTYVRLVSQLVREDAAIIDCLTEEIKLAEQTKRAEELLEQIQRVARILSERMNDKKQKQTSQLRDQVMAYICDSFANPNLSLYMIASRFGMTEVYMSRFFKEHAGENISQYIERIRMETAKKLLVETQTSVNEVAEQVGYTSAQVFRRAYKRVYGTVPSART
ncbi:helix-turn-helix domain-containing protein [Paenibacillus cymbidii]|uniref:helix-turn-helix domain-containing protein n=1 Tax=Paenibacillus cymbidii TaxID=1639034 RepID=UPI0014368B9C|nr:helix-turn-helix domain-containing protein [Paenibacillus cymbidii]